MTDRTERYPQHYQSSSGSWEPYREHFDSVMKEMEDENKKEGKIQRQVWKAEQANRRSRYGK